MTRTIATTIIAVFGLLFIGCEDENDGITKVKLIRPSYKNLTENWHVLHNLHVSHNWENEDVYVALLDENFEGWFYASDVGVDGIPESWGQWEEAASGTEMLSGGGGKYDNPVLEVALSLSATKDATWEEFEPDQNDFPGEMWYKATVTYGFTIQTANDLYYITAGSPKAEFTVRQQPDNTWRLVVWRDLFDGGPAKSPGSSTEETTWGRVKWLYYAPERS